MASSIVLFFIKLDLQAFLSPANLIQLKFKAMSVLGFISSGQKYKMLYFL